MRQSKRSEEICSLQVDEGVFRMGYLEDDVRFHSAASMTGVTRLPFFRTAVQRNGSVLTRLVEIGTEKV